MSDEQNRDIRRVSHKDQKKELKGTGSLFPQEEGTPYDDLSAAFEEDDSELLSLDELEALVTASNITTPEKADESSEPDVAASAATLKQRTSDIIEADRYPPIPQPFRQAEPGRKPRTQPKPPRRRARGNWRHDVVAGLFLMATAALIVYFFTIWNDPFSPLNPLAPPTPFIIVSETPDPNAMAAFAATQTAEARPRSAGQGSVPSVLPFTLVDSGVIYTPNGNSSGCDWASIAGTVMGMQGEPVNGYGVAIKDAEDETSLNAKVFSGSAVTFGDGGFELVLSGTPQAGTYTVQLFSPAGAPVSEAYTVTTRDTCDENVAIVSFVQVRAF